MKPTSLGTRALRMAAVRIGLVAALAGVLSYKINHDQIEHAVRQQLVLSTSERIQREASLFTEVADIQRNFLREFMESYDDPKTRAEALVSFDDLFVLDADGAWRETPSLYDGMPTPRGLRFPKIGAVKIPGTEPLTDDCKARMVLAVQWVHRYGNALRERHLNFSATLPEHVLVMFAPDIPFNSREVRFTGTGAFRLEDYESFTLSLRRDHDGFGVTPMYLDPTINTWMVTAYAWLASPPGGAKLASASLDIPLGRLMERSANPGIPGCSTVILRDDSEGKVIYHPALLEEIKKSQGTVSAKSTGDPELLQIQAIAKNSTGVEAAQLVETPSQFIAVGHVQDAQWILAVRYPKNLIRPAILQNLAVVAAVGLVTLLVELFILRAILKNQVARPLAQLIKATRQLGTNGDHLDTTGLPTNAQSEVGQLARDFTTMAMRVEEAHDSLEAKVALRTREAAAAQAEAVAANHAKSAFLANMSHEIRTPMNAILGFAQIMRSDPALPKDQLARVDPINRAGEHLLSLIDDILEMSKIEAGHLNRSDSAFDLHAVLGDLLDIYGARARAKGLSLVLERSPTLPQHIVSDEAKLRQILVNLLGNAIKFTKDGSIILIAAASRNDDGAFLLSFTVRDTGPGISAEGIAALFRPFVQSTAGMNTGGTGLGLAISRQYARLLGGDVLVVSDLGKGAAFTFTAAVAAAQPEEITLETGCPSVQRLEDGKTARILVVDDVAVNLDVLTAMLNPVGFITKTAANGAETLEIFHAWHPDAILMDMRMPVMDGYEIIRRIRTHRDGQSVFIVGLTASAFEEDKSDALAAGADAFLRKPFRRDELMAMLGERLHLRYFFTEPQPITEFVNADSSQIPEGRVADLRKACAEADYEALLALSDALAADGHAATAAAVRERALAFDYEGLLQLLAAQTSRE